MARAALTAVPLQIVGLKRPSGVYNSTLHRSMAENPFGFHWIAQMKCLGARNFSSQPPVSCAILSGGAKVANYV
jgi:hypothetical protein